jgi:hypothetical protein
MPLRLPPSGDSYSLRQKVASLTGLVCNPIEGMQKKSTISIELQLSKEETAALRRDCIRLREVAAVASIQVWQQCQRVFLLQDA